MHHIQAWEVRGQAEPLVHVDRNIGPLAPTDVLVRISGCGVCHTDLGFFFDGVRTVKPFPLILGHEISGFVTHAGSAFESLVGKAVIVPAVLPCGECDLCRKGRRTICRKQKMPGNHFDGGFASHIVVPGRYLCPVNVPDENSQFGASGVTLRELSVVADAVTTPYQAIRRAELSASDVAVVIGVGGIGGFGVQLAKAMGAAVVGIDISDDRLELISSFGADLTLNPKKFDAKSMRKEIQGFAEKMGRAPFEWKIFEMSGTAAGQELAFGLLTFGATLSVVGYTMDTMQLRLSNLMAYDARAIGNWGCDPELYPEVLDLVRQGKVQLAPFVERHPLSSIQAVFEQAHLRKLTKRAILIPDFT